MAFCPEGERVYVCGECGHLNTKASDTFAGDGTCRHCIYGDWTPHDDHDYKQGCWDLLIEAGYGLPLWDPLISGHGD